MREYVRVAPPREGWTRMDEFEPGHGNLESLVRLGDSA